MANDYCPMPKAKLFPNDSGGYREGETPCSFSNQEAKTLFADNTAPYWSGNVGRRPFRLFLAFLFIPLLLC